MHTGNTAFNKVAFVQLSRDILEIVLIFFIDLYINFFLVESFILCKDGYSEVHNN